MKISCVQLAATDYPKEKNVEHALDMIDKAPNSDLFMLPELWPSGFFSFHRYFSESETIDGDLVGVFRNKAAQRKSYILMGSFVEKADENLYNTTVLINPVGEVVCTYRKIHLFGYQSQESQILTSGKDVQVTQDALGQRRVFNLLRSAFPRVVPKDAGQRRKAVFDSFRVAESSRGSMEIV